MPGPSAATDNPVNLPTFEEMMFQDMLEGGPSSMETPPDLNKPANLDQVALQRYLFDEKKPFYTSFVLPHQGNKSTCPVHFGSGENKQKTLDVLCKEMNTKVLNQWRTFACHCG